jgi:hypothetical protein
LEILTDEGEKLAIGNSMVFEIISLALLTPGPILSLVDTASAADHVGST